MQQNIRTNEKTFLNSIKETVLTINKMSHLDYADIICDKPFNAYKDAYKKKREKVQQSIESFPVSLCRRHEKNYLIITGAIKGTSRECLYKELGLESFCDRRCHCKLIFIYKIVKGLAPSYLQSYFLPDNERTYNTRTSLRNTIKTFAAWT